MTSTSLRERALLATLHVSSWSGVIQDKDSTNDVITRNQAESGAARVMKAIMSRRNLKNIHSQLNAARATHKLLTSPWDGSGTGIFKTAMYIPYTEKMRLHRLGVEAARDAFAADYDYAVQTQRVRLGSLFKQEDYPPAAEVARKFSIDVEIKPLPAHDFRIDLGEAQAKAIAKDVQRRTEERIEGAIKSTFERVLEVTGKMAERLKEGDAVFRDTLVTNCIELADLLPALNITEDKRLDDIAKRLRSDLGEHSPEILRSDPTVRAQVASKADALFERVKAYL